MIAELLVQRGLRQPAEPAVVAGLAALGKEAVGPSRRGRARTLTEVSVRRSSATSRKRPVISSSSSDDGEGEAAATAEPETRKRRRTSPR